MKFVNGDTLLARITPCLENGKSTYVTFLKDGQVGWGSTEFIVMRSKENLHPLFTYALAKNRDFRDYAEGCLEGSSGRQRVNIDHLVIFEITIPSTEIMNNFNSIMKGIEPKLQNNFMQIRTLEKLRDTLLPKLMSGEVQVEVN
jgi:type I restriction enzyme S subunit